MNFFSDRTCYPKEVLQYLLPQTRPFIQKMQDTKSLTQSAKSISASEDYSFFIYDEVADIPGDWDQLLEDRDVFLHTNYLMALASNPPEGMQLKYLLLKKGDAVIGVVLLQIIDYALTDSLKTIEGTERRSWSQWLSYKLASYLNFRVLVVGNLLLTGEHACCFDPTQISEAEGLQLIGSSLKAIKQQLTSSGLSINGILFKDTFGEESPFKQSGTFHRVTFQPNMILKLPSNWNSFEDYLQQLQSKYRVRAKRAFKKAAEVKITEWNLEEIEAHKQALYSLYLQIAEKAEFNMLNLSPDYLPSLKRSLKADFRLFAYHDKQGELLGFCTLIRNGSEHDAHFLGINPVINQQYQLYLNMLFNMLRCSIETQGINTVVFGRTALEIKSSIGALPYQMYCYLRHLNPVFNLLIGLLMKKYNPVVEWLPRHPFK
ncbi:MAG: peptidogalycan biosysnthesis protein [Saprospiraceae bacterium]